MVAIPYELSLVRNWDPLGYASRHGGRFTRTGDEAPEHQCWRRPLAAPGSFWRCQVVTGEVIVLLGLAITAAPTASRRLWLRRLRRDSGLLRQVSQGRSFLITRRGRPVAELRPVPDGVSKLRFVCDKGTIVSGDVPCYVFSAARRATDLRSESRLQATSLAGPCR